MRLQLDSSTLSADSARAASAAQAGTVGGSRQAERRVANADSIGISGTSIALSRLSEERSDRIQQLTASVRSGTYNVPGAAISGAILAQAYAQ